MDNDAPVGSSAFIGGDLTALARRHHGAAGSAGDASQPHRKHIDAARSSSYPTSTSSKLKRRRKCTDLANDDFPHEQYGNGLLPPPPSPLPQNVFGGPPQSRAAEPSDDATMEAHIASPTTARTAFFVDRFARRACCTSCSYSERHPKSGRAPCRCETRVGGEDGGTLSFANMRAPR